jgi:signal transduction histidine kinase
VHLSRLLDNLIGNAIKFTPSGGSITICLKREDSTAILEVSDTGVGIPGDKLDRVFERFFQVDGSSTRRYGGTGLGLALVKEIAISHGGQVTVESTLGKGSIFRVTLPLNAE